MGWDRYQLGQPAVEVLAQAPLLNVQSGHSNGSFGNRKSRNSRNIKALHLSSFPKWNGVKQNESCIQVVASSGWDGALLCGKGTMSGTRSYITMPYSHLSLFWNALRLLVWFVCVFLFVRGGCCFGLVVFLKSIQLQEHLLYYGFVGRKTATVCQKKFLRSNARSCHRYLEPNDCSAPIFLLLAHRRWLDSGKVLSSLTHPTSEE